MHLLVYSNIQLYWKFPMRYKNYCNLTYAIHDKCIECCAKSVTNDREHNNYVITSSISACVS